MMPRKILDVLLMLIQKTFY